MQTNHVKEKLQALFEAFTKNLPNKIRRLETQWKNLEMQWDPQQFQDFYREVHSLCGSAGTYGYTELGKSARSLEEYLKPLLTIDSLPPLHKFEIASLLGELRLSLEQAVPKALPGLKTADVTKSNLVYLLGADQQLIQEVKKFSHGATYYLQPVAGFSDLISAIKQDLPFALYIDLDYLKEDQASQLIQIRKEKAAIVPVLCVSDKNDLPPRLKAIRIGSQFFLQKPVDAFYLSKILDSLCDNSNEESYRILIVDDSQTLAEYYALILKNAGMTTKFITNPLSLLNAIDEFQPDLILMDIYMPNCTGLELAAVLRQEARYMRIPIIFLSTEENRFKQLSALNIGGDDFLTKPVLPRHLIETVRSRAKRASSLNYFMIRDSLTGLLNHTNILQRLEVELARASRQGFSVSFVMLDIDHFKKVNDNHGHPMGDKVLKNLSSLLLSSLRKTDIVGRYGGEEFAIIMPNTEGAACLIIMNTLREKFERLVHNINSHSFHATFSAGIANFPPLSEAKSLIASADKALYLAKREGRNRIVCFEMQSEETPS